MRRAICTALVAASDLTPRTMIASAPSGRAAAALRLHDAHIQTSASSGVVRTTGAAFGWTANTSALAYVIRNAKRSLVDVSPTFGHPQRSFERWPAPVVFVPASSLAASIVQEPTAHNLIVFYRPADYRHHASWAPWD